MISKNGGVCQIEMIGRAGSLYAGASTALG